MEILFIMAGVGVLAFIVWCAENREAVPKRQDWPTAPVDTNGTSIGTFAKVTDEVQAAAEAEDAYIRSVAKDLPKEFMLDGVRVEIGLFLRGAIVLADNEVVVDTTESYLSGWRVKVPLPEIWTVLRPRLQQIADERKAAAEAEKAAKHADILRKLGGAV